MTIDQQTLPLLPLETFRQFLQYNPYHFWGMANSTNIPVTSNCNDLIPEYGHQAGYGVGRDELRQRILYAEQVLFDYLAYDVAPRYRVEIQPWPRREDHIPRRIPTNSYGEYLSVTLNGKKVQAVGVETVTTISTNVAVTTTLAYKTSDTFTLSVATTATEPDEIAVYFNATDRAAASGVTGEPIAPQWRIQPVSVSISNGIATITGSTWLLAKPEGYTALAWSGLDPSASGVLATSLDVARVWIDPNGATVDTAQGTLVWETWPWPGGLCPWYISPNNPNSTDPAAVGKAIARVGIRDAGLGIVTPGGAVYNSTANPAQWVSTPFPNWTEPDRVQVRYLAGVPLQQGRMNRFWAEVVCMLTLAEIPGPICACKEANKRLGEWQTDLARSSGSEQFAYISREALSNPFGTRRGHVEAWMRVRDTRTLSGIAV